MATETADKIEVITARELLEQVFALLKQKFNGREIEFARAVWSEIADDSDWHRQRTGYTIYKSFVVLKIGNKRWAIAFGTRCRSYTTNRYNCDISAIPITNDQEPNEELSGEIRLALVHDNYFRNALIIAMDNGTLGAQENSRFGHKVINGLKPTFSRFVAQNMKDSDEYVQMDGQPLTTTAQMYTPELIPFLADIIEKVMTEQE